MDLIKGRIYAVCKTVSKYLEYLDNQLTRATEAGNVRKKNYQLKSFLVRKIKAVPDLDLFWG